MSHRLGAVAVGLFVLAAGINELLPEASTLRCVGLVAVGMVGLIALVRLPR